MVLLLASAVVALLAPRPALACSCARGTDQRSFASSVLVFTGVARAVVDPREGEELASTGDELTWTFGVERVHKGTAAEDVAVVSARGGSTCGVEFRVGQRYQVFASEGDPPRTSICSGTRLLAAGVEPYEPAPPTALIVGAVLGALALIWSFRRVRELRLPIDPGPRAPMD